MVDYTHKVILPYNEKERQFEQKRMQDAADIQKSEKEKAMENMGKKAYD